MRPTDEAQLAEALRQAKGPVRIRGGGTRGAAASGPAEVIETGALSGIRLYEPGALTLVAGAGTPLQEVAQVLAEKNQRLPFEPMDCRALLGREGTPTLGGVAATNLAGPRRVQAGAVRDFMLGVRFVDGSGRVIANGGRVMKNVTGYDLVKLLGGSWGRLGVMTELAFKVLAIPQAEATLIRRGETMAEAVPVLCQAMGTPFDVSGAAWAEGARLVRVEGMAGSVAYRAAQLDAALGGGHEIVEDAESAALWRDVRDVTAFADRPGAVWRVSVKPTDGPRLIAALAEAGLAAQAICDWSGGLLWLLLGEDGDAGAGVLRGLVTKMGGHATLFRAGPDLRRRVPMFHPEPAGIARLTEGLRRHFDPRGLFSEAKTDAATKVTA
ncbi:FAD-binding protein [Pseudooceanicola aestuarii]|uniref:FAD-binding protein n=1 Tax=Pseudooceanicola aestuarii TaxID=2697319 RepID=UPI0013D30CC8|nr:FAD-binding protein [Pseudooceanicola aestuarii]